jgi:metal-dependent amidase/aminoacylase/carboxypeptidase family protein
VNLMKLSPTLIEDATAWRRDFHAAPELGFEELRTSARVAQLLESFGIEVHQGLGGTGVVGTLRTGAGPTIGIRADMDALPIQELGAHAHASTHTRVACTPVVTTATPPSCWRLRGI